MSCDASKNQFCYLCSFSLQRYFPSANLVLPPFKLILELAAPKVDNTTNYISILQVRNYLLNECSVIYECKTCFNMFRSLANFISHKRSFCTSRLKDVRHVYHRDADQFTLYEGGDTDKENATPGQSVTTAFVQPEPVDTVVPEQEWDLSAYSPSLELMREAGLIQEIESRPAVTSLLPGNSKKPGLDFIVRQLRAKVENGPDFDFYKSEEKHVLRLEKLRQTPNAMFQVILQE